MFFSLVGHTLNVLFSQKSFMIAKMTLLLIKRFWFILGFFSITLFTKKIFPQNIAGFRSLSFLSYWDTRQPKKYGEEFKKYKLICPFMTPKMMLFAHSASVSTSHSAICSDIKLAFCFWRMTLQTSRLKRASKQL
jgi:hypothetical protein